MLTLHHPPPPDTRQGTDRHWCCSCGAKLGLLVYARGKPVELHPTAPLVRVNGAVLWFRCLECEAVNRWVVRVAIHPAA